MEGGVIFGWSLYYRSAVAKENLWGNPYLGAARERQIAAASKHEKISKIEGYLFLLRNTEVLTSPHCRWHHMYNAKVPLQQTGMGRRPGAMGVKKWRSRGEIFFRHVERRLLLQLCAQLSETFAVSCPPRRFWSPSLSLKIS